MLIPSCVGSSAARSPSLSRRVNANSQRTQTNGFLLNKLIKKGEC